MWVAVIHIAGNLISLFCSEAIFAISTNFHPYDYNPLLTWKIYTYLLTYYFKLMIKCIWINANDIWHPVLRHIVFVFCHIHIVAIHTHLVIQTYLFYSYLDRKKSWQWMYEKRIIINEIKGWCTINHPCCHTIIW